MTKATSETVAHSPQAVPEYGYEDSAPRHTAPILLPTIEPLLPNQSKGNRALDLGCGNGANAHWLAERGWHVVGIDASEQGIAHAQRATPGGRFEVMEIVPDLLEHLEESPFDLVISTEVVEHLYAPRDWARAAFNALKPGGELICSTPYNGYLKNLALSVFNKWDFHLNPLWDGGHVKFWSKDTLSQLLREAGFTDLRFRGAGRLPLLWMGMVMSSRKPRCAEELG